MRETIFEKISLLAPQTQIGIYFGTAAIFGFFLWTIYRVRIRVGRERWDSTPLVFRFFYVWPLMTKKDRILFVFTTAAMFGWGYIVYLVLETGARL